MSLYWREHTWSDLQAKKPDVVLLPIGSTEAHGPHLPLSTDSIISTEVARRAAEQLQAANVHALILPPIHYVITDFSGDFPGTIGITKNTFQSVLNDIADSLEAQGIETMCVVNSHLEPDHLQTLHALAHNRSGKLHVLFPDKTRRPWGSLLTEEFKKGACHAGSYETSLVLASEQESLVRENRKSLTENPVNLAKLMIDGVRSFREAGADQAYFGNPAAASREEGEQIYEVLTRMIVETILNHEGAKSQRIPKT